METPHGPQHPGSALEAAGEATPTTRRSEEPAGSPLHNAMEDIPPETPAGAGAAAGAAGAAAGAGGARARFAKLNRYVVACTLLASLNSILLGYDIGVMSGALLFIKDDFKLSKVQQEILVGSLNLVSLVGGLIAGRLSDAVGRRKTMGTAAAIFLVGALLMALAPSFAVLMAGRVIAGIGVGFGFVIAPVYSAELSPSANRGSLVSFAEVFINTGILFGYVSNFALSPLPRKIGWRLMLGLGAVPAVFLGSAVLVMPESPRWLVMRRRISEAKTVLVRTSGGDKEEAETRLAAIVDALGEDETHYDVNDSKLASGHDPETPAEELQKSAEKPNSAADGVIASAHSPSMSSTEKPVLRSRKRKALGGEGVWKQLLLPSAPVRRMLIVSLGIHFFQQASGVDALVYYSPTVFHQAGIRSRTSVLGMTTAVGLTKTLFILVATIWLDTLGRRPLLLCSASGMAVALATVATSFRFLHVGAHGDDDDTSAVHGHTSPALVAIAMLAICGFMASFSIGFGPTVYVTTSEIFPLTLRAQAMSLSMAVNRAVSGTVALTFLSIASALTTSGAFYLFASVAVVSVVFIFFMVPETKGKTLEEVCKHFGWEAGEADKQAGHELKQIGTEKAA